MNVCAVVFARAPSKGKTRLADEVGRPLATRLARAFLVDTIASLRRVEFAHIVLSTPDKEADWGFLGGVEIWPQRGEGLGARLEVAVRDALAAWPRVVLLGADSPGIPPKFLGDVVQGLVAHDIVIAPAVDGGFWALGARKVWEGALEGVRWSHEETGLEAREAFRRSGFDVGDGPLGWDVDDLRGLAGLWDRRAEVHMPATLRVLASPQAQALWPKGLPPL